MNDRVPVQPFAWRAILTTLGLLVGVTLSLLAAEPGGEEDTKEEKAAKALQAVDNLSLAQDLIAYGRSSGNPEAMLTAARIVFETPTDEHLGKTEGATKAPQGAAGGRPKELLEEARFMRPGDTTVTKLINETIESFQKAEDQRNQEKSRGRTGGAVTFGPFLLLTGKTSSASFPVNAKSLAKFVLNLVPNAYEAKAFSYSDSAARASSQAHSLAKSADRQNGVALRQAKKGAAEKNPEAKAAALNLAQAEYDLATSMRAAAKAATAVTIAAHDAALVAQQQAEQAYQEQGAHGAELANLTALAKAARIAAYAAARQEEIAESLMESLWRKFKNTNQIVDEKNAIAASLSWVTAREAEVAAAHKARNAQHAIYAVRTGDEIAAELIDAAGKTIASGHGKTVVLQTTPSAKTTLTIRVSNPTAYNLIYKGSTN